MLTFLFEQYGYYPTNFINNVFYIDDWMFKLIETEFDEKYLDDIDNYLYNVRNVFSGKGLFIIRNRFNKKISIYDNKKYVLVSVVKDDLTLKDLNKFHISFREEKKEVNLSSLFSSWNQKINDVERIAVNSLRVDSVCYKQNLEITMFCLGLAQNSLQYLNDTIHDYGEIVKNVTLTHRSIENLNSMDFFDPFNYIIDHPIRDLVQLYKSNFIQFEDLVEMMNYYEIDTKLASLLMCRVLYPRKILDLLQNNSYEKNIGFKIEYNIEKEFLKIRKLYIYLRKTYKIRPIDWL